MIAINSFMTIWLLTVPEKFKEWYKSWNKLNQGENEPLAMNLNEKSKFPDCFPVGTNTSLAQNQDILSYEFLPCSWNFSLVSTIF